VNQEPVTPGPGRDEDPPGGPAGPGDFPELGSPRWQLLPPGSDPMDDPQVREAYLDSLADDEDPGDLDLYQDPDNAPPPGLDDAGLAVLIAEAREVTEDQARAAAVAARLGTTAAMAAVAAVIGRRGPGMPGSACSFAGEYTSRAAGFATGKPLDTAPGCTALGLFAEDAAGDGDRYATAADDEVLGAICAWNRVEAHASARKHAAVAELIRRRPARDCAVEGPAQMPAAWDEFSNAELAPALGESRGAAEDLLGLAWDLEVKLPGTRAAFRAGIVTAEKAGIIAAATAVLDPAEARAAEALVLGRAGPLAGVIPPGFAAKVNLTIPLATLLGLADRPGEIGGIGPIDPDLARDLAAAAARSPRSTWCVTVTDPAGHAIGHGCARPEPANGVRDRAKRATPRSPGGPDPPPPPQSGGPPGFAFTATDPPGPPGGYGRWRLATGTPGRPGLIVTLEAISTEPCDHRHQARGHDPGVMLRHLAQVRHATCTGPMCRRPAARSDFEHNIAYEAGGRTCLCNGHPKCRHDHRMKQDPRWQAEQLASGDVRWTAPSGRQYTTEPTRYPI
jgi:hypothetical protein